MIKGYPINMVSYQKIQRTRLVQYYEPNNTQKMLDCIPQEYIEYVAQIVEEYCGPIDTTSNEGKLDVLDIALGILEVIQCTNDGTCTDEVLEGIEVFIAQLIPQSSKRERDMARLYDLAPKIAIPAIAAVDQYDMMDKYS